MTANQAPASAGTAGTTQPMTRVPTDRTLLSVVVAILSASPSAPATVSMTFAAAYAASVATGRQDDRPSRLWG